jgi:hypothetical protein
MQVIDFLQVTKNKMVEKRFPQAGGVGGKPNLGEETEKMEQKNGTGDQENGSRIVRAGVWTVVIKGLGFATASIVRRWMEIICKHLWPPAVGGLAVQAYGLRRGERKVSVSRRRKVREGWGTMLVFMGRINKGRLIQVGKAHLNYTPTYANLPLWRL